MKNHWEGKLWYAYGTSMTSIAEGKYRVILIAKTGIGVIMLPKGLAVLLLQFDEPPVKIAIGCGTVYESHGVAYAVGLLEFAVGEHIQIDVDALLL